MTDHEQQLNTAADDNNNNHDDGAVIMAKHHCESSPGSYDECRGKVLTDDGTIECYKCELMATRRRIVLQVDWRRYSKHFFVREQDEVDSMFRKQCCYRDTVYIA